MITRENYEAYLSDRLDGLLSEEQQKELDNFLNDNKDLLSDTSLVFDDGIRFEYATKEQFLHKDKLYKPVFIITKWMKAAAVVLLVVSISYFAFVNRYNMHTDNSVKVANLPVTVVKDKNTSVKQQINTLNQPEIVTKSQKTNTKHQIISTKRKIVSEKNPSEQMNGQNTAITDSKEIVSGPIAETKDNNTEITPFSADTEPTNLIVYKQTDKIRSDNLVVYKPQEAKGLKKFKNKVTNYVNKIRV